jgi:hypothetical protein
VSWAEARDLVVLETVGWGPVIPTISLTDKDRSWNHAQCVGDVPGPEFPPVRRGGLPDQPHHARADCFSEPTIPPCSIIRPTETTGAAMAAVQALTADGLFIGQSNEFFQLLQDLASEADAAQRGFLTLDARATEGPPTRGTTAATALGWPCFLKGKAERPGSTPGRESRESVRISANRFFEIATLATKTAHAHPCLAGGPGDRSMNRDVCSGR